MQRSSLSSQPFSISSSSSARFRRTRRDNVADVVPNYLRALLEADDRAVHPVHADGDARDRPRPRADCGGRPAPRIGDVEARGVLHAK